MMSPSSRCSEDLATSGIGSSPVKNEVKRNQPYYPRLAEGTELITREMLLAFLVTVVDIYRAPTVRLTLC